jgi:hypothetical protein
MDRRGREGVVECAQAKEAQNLRGEFLDRPFVSCHSVILFWGFLRGCEGVGERAFDTILKA